MSECEGWPLPNDPPNEPFSFALWWMDWLYLNFFKDSDIFLFFPSGSSKHLGFILALNDYDLFKIGSFIFKCLSFELFFILAFKAVSLLLNTDSLRVLERLDKGLSASYASTWIEKSLCSISSSKLPPMFWTCSFSVSSIPKPVFEKSAVS